MIDEINAKRVGQLNQLFLPSAERALQDFKDGNIESMVCFARAKDGTEHIFYSHSISYERDVVSLLSMALSLLGFTRTE